MSEPTLLEFVKYWPYDYVVDGALPGDGPDLFMSGGDDKIYFIGEGTAAGIKTALAGTEWATVAEADIIDANPIDDGVGGFDPAFLIDKLHLNIERIEGLNAAAFDAPILAPGATVELVGGEPGDLANITVPQGQSVLEFLKSSLNSMSVDSNVVLTTMIPIAWALDHVVEPLNAGFSEYTDAVSLEGADIGAAGAAFAEALHDTFVTNYEPETGIVVALLPVVVVVDTGIAATGVGSEPTPVDGEDIVSDGTNWYRVHTFGDFTQMEAALVNTSAGFALNLAAGEIISDIRLLEYGPPLSDPADLSAVEAATRSLADADANGVSDMVFVDLGLYLATFGFDPTDAPKDSITIDPGATGSDKFVLFEGRGYEIDELPYMTITDPVDLTLNLSAEDDNSWLYLDYVPSGSRVHLHNDGAPIKITEFGVRAGVDFSMSDGIELGYFEVSTARDDTADDTVVVGDEAAGNYVTTGGGDDIISLAGTARDSANHVKSGDGDDLITAGPGADKFSFFHDASGGGEGYDAIAGFDPSKDTIEFKLDDLASAGGPISETVTYTLGDEVERDLDGGGSVTIFTGYDDYGNATIYYGDGDTYEAVMAQNSIKVGGVNSPVYISETGERWGNYIKYGVYASDDITTSDLTVELAFADYDYLMVADSSELSAKLDSVGAVKNEEYTTELPIWDGYSFTSFGFATNSLNPVSISKGEKLYEFMLQRDTNDSKLDTLTLANVSTDYFSYTNIEHKFSFMEDHVSVAIEAHSGEVAPNAKFFTASGSVMDGLVIVPKATQSIPDVTDPENIGTGFSLIEYDIELRVSEPMLTVPLTLEDFYLVRVGGGVDFSTIYNNLDTGSLPAGLTPSDIKFYRVDEDTLRAGDKWSDVKASATEVIAKNSGSDAAWEVVGDDLAEGTEALYIEFNTSNMKSGAGFAGGLTDGSFTLASFMSTADDVPRFEISAGEIVNFALHYETFEADQDLEATSWGSNGAGINLTWEFLTETGTLAEDVADGSEVYLLGDHYYANPIGAEQAITARDATLALDVAASIDPDYDNVTYIAADFNQDGRVDNVDAQEILRYSARIKEYTEGGNTKYVPIPEWYYIDDVEDNPIPDLNSVGFDQKIDYFVGKNMNINATGVLVGDVSANYVAVDDKLNPVYFDQPDDADNGNADNGNANNGNPINGNTGGMHTVVIPADGADGWTPTSDDDADAIMVDGVARHLTAINLDVTANVDAGHDGDEGHNDTWEASISVGGMMTLVRTVVGDADALVEASLAGARDAALKVVKSQDTVASNEQVFVGYVDSGKTYVWEILETGTDGEYFVDTEYEITGVATALNTNGNAAGEIYLDGFTSVSGSATIAPDETYVLSASANVLSVTPDLIAGGAPTILNFDKSNDTLDLSSYGLTYGIMPAFDVRAADLESITAAVDAIMSAGSYAGPFPGAEEPNLVVLVNVDDVDPGMDVVPAQVVLIDISGEGDLDLALGFSAETFTSLSEVVAAIDLTA